MCETIYTAKLAQVTGRGENGLNEPSSTPSSLFLLNFHELVHRTQYHNNILSTMVCHFLLV